MKSTMHMELEMSGVGDTNYQSIINGGISDQHVSHVNEVDEDWLTVMESKINQPPKLLNESAGQETCCIFKVPQSLVETNQNAYRPHIVSIGPFYHGSNEKLEMIQEHKWRFLRNILARTRPRGIGYNELYHAIKIKEEEIKQCYSETIDQSCDITEMMVLDGCFVIELFRKVQPRQSELNHDPDPILTMAWVLPFIARDLLKLGNQIPFFVLEILVRRPILALGQNIPSMKNLTLGFFRSVLGRPIEVSQRHERLRGKHILDLFRLSMIPFSPPRQRLNNPASSVCLIPSAQKLRLVGIKFLAKDTSTTIDTSILDIEFDNGNLRIPNLMMDDFSTSLLLNCVAFEQFYHYCSKDVTSYATFMGCLINTPKDAEFLRDKKIIENYLGCDENVSGFFNNLGKDFPTDIHDSYLTELFEEVNEYSSKGCHVVWAGFINAYFRSRWSIISAIVGSLLLISAMVQAFFSVYQYNLQRHESCKNSTN